MNKLFVLSYSRILQRLGASEITAANAHQLLVKNSVAPTSEALLYRLPRQELKHVLNIPCPVNNLEQVNAIEIIKSSKLLRNHVKYSQEKICAKCPHVGKCPQAKKSWAGEKYDNTTKDLLLYFSGLNNYLQPDSIYYRQWVSAYRLGDTIIACIDDLAQGGKQIQEYQKIRQQGIRELQAKGFQSSNEAKDAAKAKKLEEQLSRMVKPKSQSKKDTATAAAGDFSFDEEPVFQPTYKSAKSSFGEQKPKRQPLKNYKGYQKIQQTQENDANQNKGQASFKNTKPSNFNKEEPYKRRQSSEGQREYSKPRREDYNRQDRNFSRPPYQKDFNRDDRNGNRPQYQKDYNREDKNSYRPKYDNYNKGERSFNNEPKQYNSNPRDRQSTRSYSQPNKYVKRESTYDNDSSQNYPRRNKSNFNRYQNSQQQSGRNDDRRGDRPQQSAYGNNNRFEQREYKNERTSFKNNNNVEQDDDSPKIREFGNKNKGYEGQPLKKAVKANPFIEKWNEDPFEDNTLSKSKNASSQLKQSLNRASPKSQPKIIQMQAIQQSGQRTGRNVPRRRRTTSQQTPSEQQ